MNLFDLRGKTALVTGASRGIGLSFAQTLAAAGCDVIGVSATLKPGSEVERLVTAQGRQFFPYACDFAERNALRTFINRVKEERGVPDILVANAGTIRRAPAAEHGDELWDEVIAVNLDAPFVLAREFGRDMVARGSG
ncbi:MAG: hypothetical protein RL095_4187, partial [Verrucomicrobiota bacterium]